MRIILVSIVIAMLNGLQTGCGTEVGNGWSQGGGDEDPKSRSEAGQDPNIDADNAHNSPNGFSEGSANLVLDPLDFITNSCATPLAALTEESFRLKDDASILSLTTSGTRLIVTDHSTNETIGYRKNSQQPAGIDILSGANNLNDPTCGSITTTNNVTEGQYSNLERKQMTLSWNGSSFDLIWFITTGSEVQLIRFKVKSDTINFDYNRD